MLFLVKLLLQLKLLHLHQQLHQFGFIMKILNYVYVFLDMKVIFQHMKNVEIQTILYGKNQRR